MTKPSDFTPENALEVQEPAASDQRKVERMMWLFRGVGAALLVIGWTVMTAMHEFGSTAFFVETMILASLGAFGFAASARAVRMAVNGEKRLRLGLLVHNMELEKLAMQDSLTQLFNRRYFFDRLERELETAQAFQRRLSVVCFDLDGVQEINEAHGHSVGDEVLENVGRFLLDQTRASDVPARIGGDEFAIILPDTPTAQANTLMVRIGKRLASLNIIDRNELTLTVQASVGCAGYPETGSTADELIQQAEKALRTDQNERKVMSGDAAGGLTPVPPVFRRAESP